MESGRGVFVLNRLLAVRFGESPATGLVHSSTPSPQRHGRMTSSQALASSLIPDNHSVMTQDLDKSAQAGNFR